MISTPEWIKTSLEAGSLGPAAIIPACLLGGISAVTSVCCTLPMLGAIVGYSGSRQQRDRHAGLLDAFAFMIGTTLALVLMGSVAALIGQVAQSTLGIYWKAFAGLAAILIGLATLNLLPLRLPREWGKNRVRHKGILGSLFFGIVMGGAVGVTSLSCNPGIMILLGVAVLEGHSFWMFMVLLAYAIGFSLPLAALLLGVSLGKIAVKTRKLEWAIRGVAGVLLIGIGFNFLATF